MGFLDKAAAKVSEATKAAQEGVAEMNAKRKADGLLRELGAWSYAKHKGGYPEADAHITRLYGELAAHEAEFGELGAKEEAAPPPPPPTAAAPVAPPPPPVATEPPSPVPTPPTPPPAPSPTPPPPPSPPEPPIPPSPPEPPAPPVPPAPGDIPPPPPPS